MSRPQELELQHGWGQAGGMLAPATSSMQHDLMGGNVHLLNTTESAFLESQQSQQEHHGDSILDSQADSLSSMEHAPGAQHVSQHHHNPAPQGHSESWPRTARKPAVLTPFLFLKWLGMKSSLSDAMPLIQSGLAQSDSSIEQAMGTVPEGQSIDEGMDEEMDDVHQPPEDEELRRAACERDVRESQRSFKHVVPKPGEDSKDWIVVDTRQLGRRTKASKEARQLLVDQALATKDQDNERFTRKLRARFDRAGVEFAKNEVRFEDLSVEADVYVGNRAMPTLPNFFRNLAEQALLFVKLKKSEKRRFQILESVSGSLPTGRLTLLLGPPGSGKTTLLKALAGKLSSSSSLKLSGKITYNGETFDKFVPQRTASYVDQVDNHIAELTVRETLDFAARCQGVGHKAGYMEQLRQREKEIGIAPDPEIDAFMRASTVSGKRHSLVTELTLRILGLEVCADTVVGNNFTRGISGGQRKRVTTGEMIVGPKKTLFMDEISTGLDSSTTFLIVKCIRNFVHLQEATVLVSLLQPAPETFDLFDDVMLLSEGHIVYHGQREGCMPFFNRMGFQLPSRKGVPEFLQEVTSRKDQAQYWGRESEPYKFVPVKAFADAYLESETGQRNKARLKEPVPANKANLDPLVRSRYALSPWAAFKACLRREWILMQRHAFLYVFRTAQVAFVAFAVATVFFRTHLKKHDLNDGNKYLGLTFQALVHMIFNAYSEMSIVTGSLAGFYKQRDDLFYPAFAAVLPTTLLRLPYSFVEALVFTGIVYYVAGLEPTASRFFIFWLILLLTHQMAVGLFRLAGWVGRTLVTAATLGSLVLFFVIVLGGYVLAKRDVHPWVIWGFWASPLMYGQQALSINELSGPQWQKPYYLNPSELLGRAVVDNRSLFPQHYWIWVAVGVLIGYAVLLNGLGILAATFLNPIGMRNVSMLQEALEECESNGLGNLILPAAIGGSGASMPQEALEERERNRLGNTERSAVLDADTTKQDEAAEPMDVEVGAEHAGAAVGNSQKKSRPHDQDGQAEMNSVKRMKMGSGGNKGMILPFEPLHLTFHDVWYRVDLPKAMKGKPGVATDAPEGGKPMLTLLRSISGAFRPGILTALVGVSGAGKTTLMDVLAGRKNSGKVEGDIRVEGHPKEQATFARVCGYVEQNDIHSPQLTVEESLHFSATLRLHDVDAATAQEFVSQVMELTELSALRQALVGLSGVSGLSVEQRKRLTIAVELVANPSIIFMDEPTTGLDARAAAIVMRSTRNTVNTGRTVVCTIHQPSIDIFEAFDDLLLLKRGGLVIYMGSLGERSVDLVNYFQGIKGVPAIKEGLNPATWMLEVSTLTQEERIGVDFAECYRDSELFRKNEELIEQHSQPKEGSEPLHFATAFPRNRITQLRMLLWKNNLTYWRLPSYNSVRFVFTCTLGLIVGAVYWRLGDRRTSEQDVENVLGALFVATIFLGVANGSTVQPVVAIERGAFYREQAAGMYGSYPYALAQSLIELPYSVVQGVLYSLITYFMFYFFIDAGKFFWYTFFTILTLNYFTLYGIMAVALSPSVQIAAVTSSAFYSLWFLFAGFIIPRPAMPGWWQWYYWLDPVSHTLYSLVVSQLGDDHTDMIAVEGVAQPESVATWINNFFGFKYKLLGYEVLILCAWNVVFHICAALALRFFNFQKR